MVTDEIVQAPTQRELPPEGGVELAMRVGGYLYFDTGDSILMLGSKHPHAIERNALLIHDNAWFMHEKGESGWYVIGWQRLLEKERGTAIAVPTAREITQACVARQRLCGRFVWMARTASRGGGDPGYLLRTEPWMVFLRQGPSGLIRFSLQLSARTKWLPSHGIVRVG